MDDLLTNPFIRFYLENVGYVTTIGLLLIGAVLVTRGLTQRKGRIALYGAIALIGSVLAYLLIWPVYATAVA